MDSGKAAVSSANRGTDCIYDIGLRHFVSP
jgi:hypothetical protein